MLVIHLDLAQYPSAVDSARLDVRWFEDGEYTFHSLESWGDDGWQCRWDRHPKPDEPRAHVHPPPEAAPTIEPSDLDSDHHLGVLFAILDWITTSSPGFSEPVLTANVDDFRKLGVEYETY